MYFSSRKFSTFTKLPARKVQFRSYKRFDQHKFRESLEVSLSDYNGGDYDEFENIFEATLDRFAPPKSVTIRGNNKPHIDRNLRRAIMLRSRLETKAKLSKKPEDVLKFKRQRNYVVKLNRQAKRKHFNKLDGKATEKDFWKSIKPLLSSKCKSGEKRILLVENNQVISKEEDIVSIFNSYFNDITRSLNLLNWNSGEYIWDEDPVDRAIKRFQSHPSIIQIKVTAK